MTSVLDRPTLTANTKVSQHESASAWITALVVLIGTLVTLMFMFWLLAMLGTEHVPAIAIESAGETGDENPDGEADDPEEPGVEEFPEVEVPQLMNALEAVPDAVSNIQGAIEKRDGSATQMGRGSGLGTRDGGGGGGTGASPWDRWRVEYTTSDLGAYAKQLSFFGIEIGVVSKQTKRIDIVSNLSGVPQSRASTRDAERKKVYFRHRNRKLRQWDEQLVARAGITSLDGRYLVQFYPPKITNDLLKLEAQFAAGEGVTDVGKEVRQTQFFVREDGGKYEYYVGSITKK